MLGKFISVREPNIKYLGLENMVRLAEVPAVADTINRYASFRMREREGLLLGWGAVGGWHAWDHVRLQGVSHVRTCCHCGGEGGGSSAGTGRASSTACRTRTSASAGAAWTCCLRCATMAMRARSLASCSPTCRYLLLLLHSRPLYLFPRCVRRPTQIAACDWCERHTAAHAWLLQGTCGDADATEQPLLSPPRQGAEWSMREELVLKTAVLAERFYPDLRWYVDSMLTLISRAGESASKDLWHSTVQLVTNYPDLHEYAARKVMLLWACCPAPSEHPPR